MSSIDLVILGIVLEKPQSAYDIQKDVEYHHFSRWTKISVPVIYKKVLQLKEKGYLESTVVKGNRFADKAVYTATEKGSAYFARLMEACADSQPSFLFDFNVVIANLNKLERDQALSLINRIRDNIKRSAQTIEQYAVQYADIPLGGKTISEQQRLLHQSLLEWLDGFEQQFKKDAVHK